MITKHIRSKKGNAMDYDRPVLSASTLCSDKVKNTRDEELGSVKDIMIDTESGKVMYYVLSFGGVFGLGDKLFAIPPQAIEIDTERKCLILDADKEVLENAPGFDKDNWPNMADTQFRDKIYGHYGYNYHHAAQ